VHVVFRLGGRALGKSVCLSVVVDRGRGSTTTIALEVMKELLGVGDVGAVFYECVHVSGVGVAGGLGGGLQNGMGFVVETCLCLFEYGSRLWGFLVFEVKRVQCRMSFDVIFRVKSRIYRVYL